MSSSGTNQLTQPTINGLSNLELTDLTTDNLNANSIDGDFFSILKIEADSVQVDNELELTNSGFITIGKNTGSEITITDTQVGYLDGVTSNIQSQINSSSTDTSQLRIDLTEAEDDINANSSLLGLQGATIDDLYSKTILQSGDSITQKTTFSGKIILSSLSNLDVGVDLQAATTNIGILSTQQSTNTSAISNNTSAISTNTTNIANNLSKINTNITNISNLSTQQSTNNVNIQNNALSIGTTSGGPVNSLFDRVKYITTNSTNTNIQNNLYQKNSNTTYVRLNDAKLFIQGDTPNLYFYRNGTPAGSGQSGIIGFNSNDDTLKISNYQTDKNISIFTRSGSSTAEINLTSNSVKANGVDVNAKFNTHDNDILQNSNAITTLNTAQATNTNNISSNTSDISTISTLQQNNLSKITTNTNSINDLQTQVPPVGSIIMYAGGSAPSGWYICDGALISKSLNIELWSLLGNTYLAGRPAQTLSFYLPDMRQLFVTGAGDNSTYPVNASNKSVGDYNGQSIMEHGHNYERPTNQFKAHANAVGTNVWRSNTQSAISGGVILPGGGIIGTDSENKPYCMAMNYIIKR
jgi:microcystin-dependent protein